MGQRGPAPKPHALRVLEGTDKYETRGRLGDIMPSGTPTPPDWLSPSEKTIWDECVRLLSQVKGLLAEVDRESLARYCADREEYVRCRETIESEGRYATGKGGGVYQHPAVGLRNKAHERMMRFEAKFAMTPADRARMEFAGDQAAKAEVDDLLA